AIADWLLQNEWMAKNKTSLRHPAGYVHGLIYMICLMGVYPFWAALIVSITHILIDTRKPLQWWRRIFKRTPNAEEGSQISLGEDQALHLVILAVMAIIVSKYSNPSILLNFLGK
ncbi:MAG: DUF3307 domain-containing protein, partial [Anaerolineales bacterium]